MAVSTAITKAYKNWPNVQTVTVQMRRNDVDVYREVTHAKRATIDRNDLTASGVALRGDETVFRLPMDLMKDEDGTPDVVIQHDRILETTLADLDEANPDMVTWGIKGVRKLDRASAWRAICSQER